jgi:hypothetical protein
MKYLRIDYRAMRSEAREIGCDNQILNEVPEQFIVGSFKFSNKVGLRGFEISRLFRGEIG